MDIEKKVEVAQSILEENSTEIDKICIVYTSLSMAIRQGDSHIDLIKLLVNYGADPYTQVYGKDGGLIYAIDSTDSDKLKECVKLYYEERKCYEKCEPLFKKIADGMIGIMMPIMCTMGVNSVYEIMDNINNHFSNQITASTRKRKRITTGVTEEANALEENGTNESMDNTLTERSTPSSSMIKVTSKRSESISRTGSLYLTTQLSPADHRLN